MTIFFTADTHFGHAGILSPRMRSPRPFADIQEHDEALVACWNAVVGPRDVVWHLGDFAYRSDESYARAIFGRLNGTKHLICGNHDKLAKRLPWTSQQDVAHVVDAGTGIWLSHYAHRAWPRSFRGDIHLYGHSHGSLPGTSRSLDVGVDCWGWTPVRLSQIRDRMAQTPEQPEELGGEPEADQDAD